MLDPNIITITLEEYAHLKQQEDWLACLEAAGVDNWSGYDYALELYEERENNEQIP